MKIRTTICSILLLIASLASAQVSYVTVTATVTDPTGNPYASATVEARLVDKYGNPVYSASTPNGQLYNAKLVQGTLDSTGTFSLQLVPNSILTNPAGTQWQIGIAAPADLTSILTLPLPWTTVYRTSITGPVDLSSQISALAQPINFLNLKTAQSTLAPTAAAVAKAGTLSNNTTGNAATATMATTATTATHAQNLPSDFESQSASNPHAGTFTTVAAGATVTKQLNKDFLCGGYSPIGSNMALDNCWADVVSYYNANASPSNQVVATVQIPSGVNTTCYGLIAPTPSGTNLPLTLRLLGGGKGEFGTGTTIKASCSMSTPVVDEPWLSASTPYSGYWSDTVAEGFTVDANNLAPKCFAFYGQRFGQFDHLSCENATDTYAWGVIGDVATQYGGQVPSGYQGQGLNVTVDDVFIDANYTAAYATITATPSAGALTFGVTGGGSYRSPLPLYVFLNGNQNGTASQPCATMPTGLQANTTFNAGTGFYNVTSITATTYGAGCSGTVYAVIPGMPANGAQYGLVLANTDSTYKDEQNDGVGILAGLYHNPGGANVVIHPHPWGMPYGIKDFGQNTIINPEFDTNFGAGMIFAYGLGTKVFSPKFVWPSSITQQAGAGGYFFATNSGGGTTTGLVSIFGEDCGNGQNFGGYNRFVQYGTGAQSAAQLIATGFLKNVSDGNSCASIPTPPTKVFVDTPQTDSALAGAVVNGEMTFKVRNTNGSAQTPYLLAKLEPYNANTGIAPSVTVELTQGTLSSQRVYERIIVANINGTDCGSGPGASKVDYQWGVLGYVGSLTSAYIQAFREADCSTNIYVVPGVFGVASVKVLNAQDPNVVIYPNPAQQTDAGTLVFDSSNPATYAYSPITGYNANFGGTITGGYFQTASGNNSMGAGGFGVGTGNSVNFGSGVVKLANPSALAGVLSASVSGAADGQFWANKFCVFTATGSYTGCLAGTQTGYWTYDAPDGNAGLVMSASLTTTAAASDPVTVTGATTSSHCTLSPTNASAATNIATTYISAKASNSITVTHTATAGMTYDLLCTKN